MHIVALPAFQDNYIWMIHDGRNAVVVDPGDAAVVEAACAPQGAHGQGLQLAGILVTHHHADHTGGIARLIEHRDIPVWGPAAEDIGGVSHAVAGGDRVHVPQLGLDLEVIDVPGHTRGHIALHAPSLPAVMCGDTLFSGGCGRLFEGTPEQMLHSLERLGALPPHTQVLCAHEYTLGNLQFARHVEPGNAELEAYDAWCRQQRSQQLPTLPSTIGRELAINPFLRSQQPEILSHVEQHFARAAADRIDAFAMLRQWKNTF